MWLDKRILITWNKLMHFFKKLNHLFSFFSAIKLSVWSGCDKVIKSIIEKLWPELNVISCVRIFKSCGFQGNTQEIYVNF